MAGLKKIYTRFGWALKDARERYHELGRFQRLRFLIVILLVLDVVGTGAFLFASTNVAGASLAVSYRTEFPTRLLVVRNRNRVLIDAEVVLDETYRFSLPRLEIGPIGLDLRDFRDEQGLPPDSTYRPRRAVIVTSDDRFDLWVGADDP